MEVLLPAIDVRNVYKSYDKKVPVLQDTSLLVKWVQESADWPALTVANTESDLPMWR